MRAVIIGMCAGVMGMVALGLLANSAAAPPDESSSDGRQRLVVARVHRDRILTEMRQMLGSVNGIVQGLATNDLSAAEKAARMSGMMHAVDTEAEIETLLPRPFLELGMHTHRGFDALADRIKNGSAHADILRELAQLTGNCIACHATYRLDEAR